MGERWRKHMPERTSRASPSIIAAAVVLLLGSLAIFLGATWYVRAIYKHAGSMNQVLLYAHDASTAIFYLLTTVEIVFGLLGMVTSIGLLRLHETARIAALFLSMVQILVVVFGLLLFAGTDQSHGGAALNAAWGIIVYGCFLVVLLPPSIWWFVLLTRHKVRSQFH